MTLMMISHFSQEGRILAWLKSGQSLTPLDALQQFGCLRLAARICDLRDQGNLITCKIVKQGDKRFAEYRLIEERR